MIQRCWYMLSHLRPSSVCPQAGVFSLSIKTLHSPQQSSAVFQPAQRVHNHTICIMRHQSWASEPSGRAWMISSPAWRKTHQLATYMYHQSVNLPISNPSTFFANAVSFFKLIDQHFIYTSMYYTARLSNCWARLIRNLAIEMVPLRILYTKHPILLFLFLYYLIYYFYVQHNFKR